MELCLKIGKNLLSLKASRTPSKINEISRVLAGVDDYIDIPGVLDDFMDGLHMP